MSGYYFQNIVYSGPKIFTFSNSVDPDEVQMYAVFHNNIEPVHEISNNVICATSKGSDQPAHTRTLIRAFASRLSIL